MSIGEQIPGSAGTFARSADSAYIASFLLVRQVFDGNEKV